ncbi:MAG: hypothetical protein LLG45_03805 [Actinomycetia bacterium]|nr:hypothetical protein [Actinomycetes bacterium]
MNCPVLTELKLTEAYEPEHENPPVLSGGSYDIDAIRSCGEGCKMAAENARLREAAAAVVARWDSPTWKDAPATAEYIATLRAALDAVRPR